MKKDCVLNVEQIKEILPHRYPFLMVDRLESVSGRENTENRVGHKAVALKNVTATEPYFQGHFPHQAIMPGVMLIEAMAQAGGLACFNPEDGKLNIMIAKINEARFRKPVVPGDTVYLEAEVLKDKGKILVIACTAKVDGEIVATTTVVAHVTKREG